MAYSTRLVAPGEIAELEDASALSFIILAILEHLKVDLIELSDSEGNIFAYQLRPIKE